MHACEQLHACCTQNKSFLFLGAAVACHGFLDWLMAITVEQVEQGLDLVRKQDHASMDLVGFAIWSGAWIMFNIHSAIKVQTMSWVLLSLCHAPPAPF